ncbi:MAG TPA: hypothetical protein GX707_19355 [Epulopiscium sp.]|nr:hypothetical protein [Candidatus Epulonipiscium sp.]
MKKMKKVILMVLLGVMVLGVTACSGGKSTGSGEVSGTLEEIMEKIYSGIDIELPGMMTQEVNAENSEFFLGVNDIKFDEALASEPMMSSQAHSVVLLRVSEGQDVEAIKSRIKENVDGRKWICVGVEENNIITDHIGNLVILIMDENSKAIQDSFLSLKE